MKTHELSIEKQSPMDVMERVIESKVKIETRPILGRVLIASEEIAAGDVIIKVKIFFFFTC